MQVMKRYLTEAEQARLRAHLKSLASPFAKRDLAWITLLKDSGMRVGEFSRMTVAAAKFALSAGWIHIPKEHRKGGKRDHDIPVTDAIRQDLAALLRLQREFGGSGADDEPLVMSRERAPLSVRSYQARMEKWCRACGMDFSPHALRHTRAMNIMRRTESPDPRGVVQGMLGHADIRSSGIYTRMNREELLAAVESADGPRRLRKRQVAKAYEQRVAA